MGRKSREKQERRHDPEWRKLREITAAERRGNRVPPTLEGYRLAAARRTKAVQEALLARHNHRFARIEAVGPGLADIFLPILATTFAVDAALTRLGASDDRPPGSYLGEWPDHVQWGLDSVHAALRMLLAGNVLGAAAVLRTQLDRWSWNRASTFGVEKSPSETTADFYRRVWSAGGSEGDLFGAAWEQLAETLHGRGELLSFIRWEATRLLDGLPPGPPEDLDPLKTAAIASLIQIRGCAISMLEGRGEKAACDALRELPLAAEPEVWVRDIGPLVWPVTTDLLDSHVPGIARTHAMRYRMMRSLSARRERFPPEPPGGLALMGFTERRSRAFDMAIEAFRQEADQLGDEFDVSQVQRRHQFAVLNAEIAALTSHWLPPGAAADALVTAAGAARAASWLWLEDDDRSLVLVRTVIEQTSRARTWRLKPTAAARAEERPPTLQRWIEEAGWRRLSIVSRSLGEFAHVSFSSRWAGAHDALSQLPELPADSRSRPEQVARGNVLFQSILLLGVESIRWLDGIDQTVAAAFWEILGLDEASVERDIDRWLDRALANKGFDLGEPMFRPPTTEEYEQVMGLTANSRDRRSGQEDDG